MKKEYQAYGNGSNFIADTPKAAAQGFFANNPKARKCNISEGKQDGLFFVVTYGRYSDGEWPKSFKDVTKKL